MSSKFGDDFLGVDGVFLAVVVPEVPTLVLPPCGCSCYIL